MMNDGLRRLAAAMIKQAARDVAEHELAAWREWAEDVITVREAVKGAHPAGPGRRVSGSVVRPVDTEAARRSARYRR